MQQKPLAHNTSMDTCAVCKCSTGVRP